MPCEFCDHCKTAGYKKPIDKRNPDIQEVLDVGFSGGFNQTKQPYQRFAITRLLKKIGKPELLKIIHYVIAIKNLMYAPQVFNFMDLEQKWEKVMQYKTRYEPKPMPVDPNVRRIIGYKKLADGSMQPEYEDVQPAIKSPVYKE